MSSTSAAMIGWMPACSMSRSNAARKLLSRLGRMTGVCRKCSGKLNTGGSWGPRPGSPAARPADGASMMGQPPFPRAIIWRLDSACNPPWQILSIDSPI